MYICCVTNNKNLCIWIKEKKRNKIWGHWSSWNSPIWAKKRWKGSSLSEECDVCRFARIIAIINGPYHFQGRSWTIFRKQIQKKKCFRRRIRQSPSMVSEKRIRGVFWGFPDNSPKIPWSHGQKLWVRQIWKPSPETWWGIAWQSTKKNGAESQYRFFFS